MPQQWYYQQDGQTRGPVSREELQQLIDSGQLHNQSQVIRDGMRDWLLVSRMDLVSDVVQPPPAKPVAERTSPQSPPSRLNPATYQGPLTRPQRPSNHLPLYFGSLAVVAILATIIGWMAHSLSSSDDDKQSEQANRQKDMRAVSKQSGDRRTSGITSRDESADSAKATSADELSDSPLPERTRTPSNEEDSSRKVVPEDPGSGPSLPDRSSTAEHSEDPQPQSTGTESEPPNTKPRANNSGSASGQVAETAPTQTAPKQEKPLVIFQELDIQRQPTLSMLGTVIAQDIHYRILSELSVGKPDEEGFRQVQQVVQDTKLVKADALSRAMFEESLKRLIGWQFSYKLNLRNEVVEIRGPDGDKKIAAVEPAGGKGFLVTSVMDEDGWKELAELSFFAPDAKGIQNQSWTRQMTHNFEPLGSWFGETTFVPRGKEQGVLRFDYAHKMTYKPPEKAAAAAGGLPFTIKNADFKAGTAGGIIYFDPRLKRVHSAQEQFHVRGTLSADALGQVLNIPVEEKQAITVRIVDQDPWDN